MYDELIKALRSCTKCIGCTDCQWLKTPCDRMTLDAADAISTLSAQFARDGELIENQAKAMERMKHLIWVLGEKNDKFTQQLATVTAERDAAVEDMKTLADAVREKYSDNTCCFACVYDSDFSVTDSGNYANECPGFGDDICFKWRGRNKG